LELDRFAGAPEVIGVLMNDIEIYNYL
jgi:hypothetical protein